MRGSCFVLLAPLFASCNATFAEPQFVVAPYMAVYRLRGDTKIGTQPAVPLANFGGASHEEDLGVRADLGDGYSGLRLDYYQLDMQTAAFGTLANAWGNVGPDSAQMQRDMDEARLSWVETVYAATPSWRNSRIDLRVSVGGMLAHRDLHLRANDGGSATQTVQAQGESLAAVLRVGAGWRDLRAELDYSLSPNLGLGGDFAGTQQDFELRCAYHVPSRGITAFVGYRRSLLLAAGNEDGADYNADLTLDGVQIGVTLVF